MRTLQLWDTYDRRDAHGIFSPDTTFTPQRGTWGLQGIVRVPDAEGSFVFFVTFGASQGEHVFKEEITEDGVLTWQSQPKQRLDSPVIQELIEHDDRLSTIHLFLRTRRSGPYVYLGELGYLDHAPDLQEPVYFTWQLLNWPPSREVLDVLGITPTPSGRPTAPAARDSLERANPPQPGARTKRRSRRGRKFAYRPGQDARNHVLGLVGEQLVVRYERDRLARHGRDDLAERVEHVSVIEGDSAGYDVRSFDMHGTPRHIEVKTTHGPASNAFYLSPNEIRFSESHAASYELYRLFDYNDETNSARFYSVRGPVKAWLELEATEYRATMKSLMED